MKLSKSTIRALTLPPGVVDRVFWDDDVPAFGLRMRAGGAQSWVVQYAIASRTRRIRLGSVAQLDPDKARKTAKDLLAQVRLGRDPAREKMAARSDAAETVGALLPRFLERQCARMKPRSFEETQRHLGKHAQPLHGVAIKALDRRSVAMLLGRIADDRGPAAANRVRTSLSAFCTWAAREGFIDVNPVLYTNKATENGPRDRLLSDDEIAAVGRALGDDDYSVIVKLLLLTGARRDEIGSLRWSEIDLDAATVTLPPARTKNRREHVITLSPQALAVLTAQPRRHGTDAVFGRANGWRDWSGAKADLDQRIAAARGGKPLTHWTLHDFRRVISTTLHERLGVLPHVVEAILGHADGHKAGVAGVYNKALYLDERRRALQGWADHIEQLVTGKKSAMVVKLRKRR
jgi:integrase